MRTRSYLIFITELRELSDRTAVEKVMSRTLCAGCSESRVPSSFAAPACRTSSSRENRKPLSYAYVAITMDNSDHQLAIDFEEVTVARRVYRSGESEYLINGSPCRLKDVTELFYDTGIGKEGYSIIGQGQIERILSGKPEERRELFDEAAGIVKYKKRKATAQKKLENERENLVRVNDILAELERQVGPLERQAEKARIYLKKKPVLREYQE